MQGDGRCCVTYCIRCRANLLSHVVSPSPTYPVARESTRSCDDMGMLYHQIPSCHRSSSSSPPLLPGFIYPFKYTYIPLSPSSSRKALQRQMIPMQVHLMVCIYWVTRGLELASPFAHRFGACSFMD